MFFYRIPDENHYSFIASQWLGSVKSDRYQKRLIINFSWKCHRNELCNIPHFCYKQNYANSLDVVNFLIVLDWFNIFFQPMLCHLWRQLLNNSDAPHLASTAQRPSISLILSERYLFMHKLFMTPCNFLNIYLLIEIITIIYNFHDLFGQNAAECWWYWSGLFSSCLN